MIFFRPLRLLLWLPICLVARLCAAPASAEQTLQLPDFTVSDSPILPVAESWRYTRAGSFEVLSNASAITTRSLLADFSKFQKAVRLVWPTPVKPLAAATVILSSREATFSDFLPSGAASTSGIAPSIFLRNREQIAIVVDLATERLTIDDATTTAVTGSNSVEYEVDHFRQLYREYVHYLLSQGAVRPPAWLEEGLAQIVMDIQISSSTMVYGKVETNRGGATGLQVGDVDEQNASSDSNSVVGEQPFNVVLQHQKFIPFTKFLATTHDSPEALSPLGNNLWAKQAYAFVHYCLFGADLRHKDDLATFVTRLAHQPVSEQLFQECFKIDYVGMEKELRTYIYRTRHKYQKYEIQGADKLSPSSIELSEATPEQIGLIKGDALRLAGKPDLATREYHTAYMRGSREPALLAVLGESELAAGRADHGRKLLDAAVQTGVNRPSAYVSQARLRLAAFKTDPGPDGRLTAVQVSAVLAPLFKARNFPPPLPDIYETIADVWSLSSVAPKTEHLAVLDEGIRAFPRNSALLLHAAQLYRQVGTEATAESIAQLGLRFATEAADKNRFEAFLAAHSASAK